MRPHLRSTIAWLVFACAFAMASGPASSQLGGIDAEPAPGASLRTRLQAGGLARSLVDLLPWSPPLATRALIEGTDLLSDLRFAVNRGQELFAPHEGRVVRIVRLNDVDMITLDHGEGFHSQFTGSIDVSVVEGASVRRQQVLGRVRAAGSVYGHRSSCASPPCAVTPVLEWAVRFLGPANRLTEVDQGGLPTGLPIDAASLLDAGILAVELDVRELAPDDAVKAVYAIRIDDERLGDLSIEQPKMSMLIGAGRHLLSASQGTIFSSISAKERLSPNPGERITATLTHERISVSGSYPSVPNQAYFVQSATSALARRSTNELIAAAAKVGDKAPGAPAATAPLRIVAETAPAPASASASASAPASAPPANRKALVIGNDSYAQVARLTTARSDASAIGRVLAEVGFAVTVKLDLGEKATQATLRQFSESLAEGDEVVFFYAGHGVQLGAVNYLLPVDIKSESEAQIRDDAIALQRILDDLSERRVKITIAMIDACRDNPFPRRGRAVGGRGLAPTSAATGQMVIFSAGIGQQALDRLGPDDKDPNGLFTRMLLQAIKSPGVRVDNVIRDVRMKVFEAAKRVGHEQVPAIYDQVLGEFYFVR